MKKKHLDILLLIASAAVTGLSVILPQYFGFMEWVSLSPAIYVFIKKFYDGTTRLRTFYTLGLLYFMSYYVVCFHWFTYLYPLSFTGLSNFLSVVVIILAWVGLSLLQALGGGFVFLIFGLFSKSSFTKRYPWLAILILPALFAVFEFSQTIGWWGVPWGRLVLGQISSIPIISTSSLLGCYVISALLVFVNTCFAFAFTNRKNVKISSYVVCAGLISFILNLSAGTVILSAREKSLDDADTLSVAALQGNISSSVKWDTSLEETFATYEELVLSAAADGADIILLPETAIPFDVEPNSSLGFKLSSLAKQSEATLVVGALFFDGVTLYNALFHIRPDGSFDETFYKKQHLVPFGEYMPMRNFLGVILPFLQDINALSIDMTPGDSSEIFTLTDGTQAGSLICFDSIYEELAINSVRDGAEIIFLSTNDSWFSDSVAIFMHNNQARLRSIELGRSTVRAANTGVSALILPTGEVIDKIDPLIPGYIVGDVPVENYRTLYSYIGNTFVYLCAAFILSLGGFEITKHLIDKKRNFDIRDSSEDKE